MYATATTGDLTFGSIISAPWLFDVYVREDSAAATRGKIKGKDVLILRTEPPKEDDFTIATAASMDPSDFALAHGSDRLAIVLTDDCELASAAGQRVERTTPRGRVLMAGIRQATAAELAKAREYADSNLRSYILQGDPAHGFAGCIADFNRIFSVSAKTLFGPDAAKYKIHVQLDRDTQLELAKRLAGFNLRQGPFAASIGARKLSQLLTANGDPDKYAELRAANPQLWGDADYERACRAVVGVLDDAWLIGGAFMDDVDAVAERSLLGQTGQVPDGELRSIVAALTRLRDNADAAIAGFEAREASRTLCRP